MDHFDDNMLFQFFVETKNQPRRSINHAKFSKSAKFHENPLQMHANMGPQTCNFLQMNVCQGASTCPISMSKKLISMELCRFTKFHMIN